MGMFQREMNQAVAEFVSMITFLARQHAAHVLRASFGGGPDVRGLKWSAVPRGRPPGTRGPKRSPERLEALASELAAYVAAKPGLRIEQINKELGTTTYELALPIRKLIAAGRLATEGRRRSTTYFPGKEVGNG
jgi:hypothetical protein